MPFGTRAGVGYAAYPPCCWDRGKREQRARSVGHAEQVLVERGPTPVQLLQVCLLHRERCAGLVTSLGVGHVRGRAVN